MYKIKEKSLGIREVEIITSAMAVVEDVVSRYDIKRYEEFKCEYIRDLAESLGYFDINDDPLTII